MLWSYTLSLPDTSFQYQLVQFFPHMLLLQEELQSLQSRYADHLSSVTVTRHTVLLAAWLAALAVTRRRRVLLMVLLLPLSSLFCSCFLLHFCSKILGHKRCVGMCVWIR